MACDTVTSSDNVDAGLLVEAVCGTLETGAAYEIFQTTGAELDYPSEEAIDNTVGDHGGPISKRTISRAGDASLPAHLRFGGNDELLSSALREAWPAEVTIVGSADNDLVLAGTHNDGATGLQIIGTAGATQFDTFITYNSATANGIGGLVLHSSGWTAGANNQLMVVKEVWKDGANGYIDLYDFNTAGGAGPGIGAQKIAATGDTPTLRVGSAIRNRQSGGIACGRHVGLLRLVLRHHFHCQVLRGGCRAR